MISLHFNYEYHDCFGRPVKKKAAYLAKRTKKKKRERKTNKSDKTLADALCLNGSYACACVWRHIVNKMTSTRESNLLPQGKKIVPIM